MSFRLDVSRAALVITDPQVDFLSPHGVNWQVVGKSVESNHTVENIERLFKAARQANMVVAPSGRPRRPARAADGPSRPRRSPAPPDRDPRGRVRRRRRHAAVQAVPA
jgi:nicotinamidase-related amidase